jgi:cytochrome c oxidase subunit 2
MTTLNALNLLLASPMPHGPWGLPEQASTLAPPIDFVFDVITWICVAFFVLIVGLMVWFMIRYSKPPGTPAESNVTHHTPLEVTWTVIPLILVIVIFYVGMKGYIEVRSAPLGAYQVNVVAQKWSWTFNYANGASPSNLIVPVNRPVKLLMSSQDVLHSLYIPAFRVKQDVVPGRITSLWFEAIEPGVYDLYCAEYCGTQHSTMLAKVEVLEDADFNARMIEEANWADKVPANKLYVGGPRLYARCKSCHSLDGSAMTGPTWQHVWADAVAGNILFTDGTELKDLMGPGLMFEGPEDYIMKSITNPQQKLVMNYSGAMPTFQGQLDATEIAIITQFLQNLDKFDAEGNPLDPDDDLTLILKNAKEAEAANPPSNGGPPQGGGAP